MLAALVSFCGFLDNPSKWVVYSSLSSTRDRLSALVAIDRVAYYKQRMDSVVAQ